MMENKPASSSRTDRKFIERNRRNQMKALYSKLNSLVPRQSSREVIPLPDQIDEATSYIKKLQMKLEKMNEKKHSLMAIDNMPNNVSLTNDTRRIMGLKSPQIEIHHIDSALQVSVITGLDCQFIFSEIIRILHEEAADIVTVSYRVVEDAVFHTIHCQVGESANGAVRISERLKRFLYGSDAF